MGDKINTKNRSKDDNSNFPRRFISYCQQIDAEWRRKAKENNAQQKQSNAWEKYNAIAITAATVVIAIATIAAALIGYYQWRALRSTDEATHIAAGAARSSATTAHDALVKAQRPFVYQKSVWYRAFIKDGQKLWRGIVEWENSGLTPTKVANFELDCPFIRAGNAIADPYALKKLSRITKKATRVSAILAPRQTKFGGQCEFTAEELVNAQQGITTQYIVGQVSYIDIFGVSHITRYCEYLYHIGGDVSGFGNIEVSGNSCIRHNCADEECEKEDAEPNLPPEKLIPSK
jgi:hypothetical protein